jgi:uncharacterized repeat protein (TIGR03847 family)
LRKAPDAERTPEEQVQRHDFEMPDRFVVGTVGQPGQRAFYLQASGNGNRVTVGLEKTEVTALAEGLVTLLAQVRAGGEGRHIPATAAALDPEYMDRAPLDGPFEEDFHLGQLTVAWDGEAVVVEAAGVPPEALAALAEEEVTVVGEEDLDVLRVMLTVEQTLAFVARANSVVAAGRPECVLCGRPDGPDGHMCPRLN